MRLLGQALVVLMELELLPVSAQLEAQLGATTLDVRSNELRCQLDLRPVPVPADRETQ